MKSISSLILKIILILTILFMICFYAFPNDFDLGSIEGIVQDQNMGIISGVEITIVGTGIKSFTDDTGTFFFSDVEPGAYSLNFFKKGYHTQQKNITVRKGQSVFVVIQMVPGDETGSSSVIGCVKRVKGGNKKKDVNSNGNNAKPLMDFIYVAHSGYTSNIDNDNLFENIDAEVQKALIYGWDPAPEGIKDQTALIYGWDPVDGDCNSSTCNNSKITKPTTNPNDYNASFMPIYRDKKKNNLLIINSITRSAVSIIEWIPSVSPMWLDITDKGILCLADSSNNITIMDTNSCNSVISTVPMGNNIIYDIAVGNSDTRLFCALMDKEPSVGVIDIVSNSYIKTIKLPRLKDKSVGIPWGIGTFRNGQMLYVTLATATGGELAFINTNTNSVDGTVTVGQNPFGVGVTPDGNKIYVANNNSGNVSVVDGNTRKVISTIPVGFGPVRIAVSPDGSKAIVTNQMSNNISVIDVKTDTIISTLPVGKEPFGVSISRDGKRAYVANHGSDDISMIDLTNNSITGNTIPFPGGKPFDVVVK